MRELLPLCRKSPELTGNRSRIALPNLIVPGGCFGITLFGHVVTLGGPYVAVAGPGLNLLHLGAVFESVGECGFSKRVGADTPAAETVGVEADVDRVLLHDVQDRPLRERSPGRATFVGGQGAEEGSIEVVEADAGAIEPAEDRRCGFQHRLSLPLAALLTDDDVPVEIRPFEIPDPGPCDRPRPAGRLEVREQQRMVPYPEERVCIWGVEQPTRFPLGQSRRRVLVDAGRRHRLDVADQVPGDEPLLAELLVGSADHGQCPGDRRRPAAGLDHPFLIYTNVVARDLERLNPDLGHVRQEGPQIIVVRFAAVRRRQCVADPRDQSGCCFVRLRRSEEPGNCRPHLS